MPAKGLILDVAQGTTFSRQFQCVDSLGGNVPTGTVDLGPHLVQVKDKPIDQGGALKATGSATINATGLVTITFTAAETRKIKDPTWLWEVKAVESGTIWSVFQGNFNLTLEVAA